MGYRVDWMWCEVRMTSLASEDLSFNPNQHEQRRTFGKDPLFCKQQIFDCFVATKQLFQTQHQTVNEANLHPQADNQQP
jgi:hypothetical protein